MKKVSFLPNSGARLGHQFVEWLIGYIYCKKNNIEFYHHDFICSSEGLDKFLNLNYKEPNFDNYRGKIIDDTMMDLDQYLNSDSSDLYLYDFFVFEELNNNVRLYLDDVSDDIRNILREKYFKDKENDLKDSISVHIRRNDVKRNNIWIDRYLYIDYYKKILNELYEKYPSYKINIFSSDVDEDFYDIKDIPYENINFYINKDIKESIHTMITSKILVTSNSGISFICTLISNDENMKICPSNFWHGWPKECIKRDVTL